ncbi:MBL fold metallo-hydrolase [Mucilaginibacter terrenus]|uniref:MBL fold metallo-hydrolase n=1 Tax=Mucilaginibacter terrenus TaxID=2482727 RepID=A0A3E2NX76_9SPHI|nr:MBL fold metallo-hydrolase [Mucilaginibacter terrenus]RFZ85592.1 MBL fold metallo-hydrolase [Mucilaginibacter terrenus]
MKIYKYLHSCLVFEKEGFKLLCDPGSFTFAEGQVTTETFGDVDAVIITHIHADHLDLPNLKKIVALSGAPVYTNSEVGVALKKEGLAFELMEEGVYDIGPFKIEAIPVVHEPLLDSPIPQMTGLLIDGRILHPADSMEDKLTTYNNLDLLILVTMAPFANELRIAAFGDKVKPKQILPVHDGFAKHFFVKSRFANYKNHFAKSDINFIEVTEPGESIEL